MSFDWSELLELARDLQDRSGPGYSAEAASRAAVSRAYYAAFCSARNHAARYMGFSPSGKAEDHRRLREHLQKRGLVRPASSLGDLRIWRNRCDYDDSVQGLKHMVRNALESAQEILETLDSHHNCLYVTPEE